MMKLKNILIVLVILVVIAGAVWLVRGRSQTNTNVTVNDTANTSQQKSPVNDDKTYSDAKNKLSFSYPKNWSIEQGPDYAQFYNYDVGSVRPSNVFSQGQNKIAYSKTLSTNIEQPVEFTEQSRTKSRVILKSGQTADRYDLVYSVGKTRVYFVPLVTGSGYASFSISGDPNNFYVLDDMVQNISWK